MKITKTIVVLSFLILLIIISGCNVFYNPYYLTEVSLEKTDIQHNMQNSNVKLFFSVRNDEELTLKSKIEIDLNKNCFNEIKPKELGEIPPKNSIRSFLDISLVWNLPETCVGKSHNINLTLKDVNGKKLDSKFVTLGIV